MADSSGKRGRQRRKKAPLPSASPPAAHATDLAAREPQPPASDAAFPIVGIGASAGGLEACTQVLEHLPAETGLAFVLVQHLDPAHQSILPELLSRVTRMSVRQVQDGMAVEPNHVYVVPPNVNMTIASGVLRLVPRTEPRGLHMPIDHFFRSLAGDQGSRAIGIILSGTGSDGALGLEEIKERGGITFVQDERTAKFAGMPHSAITHASIDFILPAEGIAQELMRIAQHPYVAAPSPAGHEEEPPPPPTDQNDLGQILRLLRGATGVDFTQYKQNTIRRRIIRRITLRKMEQLGEYAEYLRAHRDELDALYHDLLIKVTGFFRDPEAFAALTREVFSRLLHERSPHQPIRIWVPGCASGEEAYSIAICLLESLGERAATVPIQIFATDIDELALKKARTGQYLENIALDVSPERLRRFFGQVDHHYRINNAIREMCTFARHNLCQDPPFSNLDLISCRNVLIYLEPAMQKRVIPLFHYALHPGGFLTLGTSETIGTFSNLFAMRDKKHKIYAKIASALRPPIDLTLREPPVDAMDTVTSGQLRDEPLWRDVDVFKEADRVILDQYTPAGVLINNRMDILQFRGDTGHYLLPAPGKASLNLLRMAREGLLMELQTAIEQAKQTGSAVQSREVQIAYEGQSLGVTVRVIPLKLPPPPASHCVVLFEEPAAPAIRQGTRGGCRGAAARRQAGAHRRNQLHEELAATKQYLQSIIEQHEAANEELQSANEEILSTNEELQSTNEELETAKEELQSTNEELSTVNDELRQRNLELIQANNDLNNLFSSGNVPIIMLGSDLRIRRFTAAAEQVLHVIPTDIGRPIDHLNLKIPIPDLEALVLEVIDTVHPLEREVQDREGYWYSLRIRPYRTTENTIDGAVLLFLDIDSLKDVDRLTHLLEEVKAARNYAEGIVQTVREPLVILDSTLRVITANPAFYRTFRVTKEATEQRFLYDLGNRQWDIPELRRLLEEILPQNSVIHDFEVDHDFPGIGRKHMLLSARCIMIERQEAATILLAIEDITERKRAEEAIRTSLKEKEVLLSEIHHRVKNNLQIISSLLSLQFGSLEDQAIRTMLEDSQRRVGAMALVHEQLYTSANFAQINLGGYLRSLTEQLLQASATSGRIGMRIQADEVFLNPDAAIPCGLIVTELISNALEHAFPAGQPGDISIELHAPSDHEVSLVVRDNGIGLLEGIDFRNTESLGLQLVCMLTEQLHGAIALDRSDGTTFSLTFPV